MPTLRPRSAAALTLLLAAAATTGFHRAQPPSVAQGPEWRAPFLAAARRIPFQAARPPEIDTGVPAASYPADAPRMTLASASTRGSGAAGAVVARITSPRAYPRLGIAPGVNYVWTDTIGGAGRQLVIPESTTYPVRWLRVTPHPHRAATKVARLVVGVDRAGTGSAGQPRPAGSPVGSPMRFAIGVCSECLGRTWCKGSDTTSLRVAWEPVVGAMTTFFRSNGINY